MAKIPTYESSVSPRTGSIGPRLDASSFGGGLGVALQHLGAQMSGAAAEFGNIAEREARAAKLKKNMEDQRWVSDNLTTSKEEFDKFKAQDGVRDADNIADQLKVFAEKQVAAITPDKAPSPEAYELFRTHYKVFAGSQVGDAYMTGVNNAIKNTVSSYDKQINQAVTTYRESDNPDKLKTFVGSVATMKGAILTSFGEHSPKLAEGLNQELIVQATLAVMGDNPLAARSFLKSESSIDEQTRLRLNGEIDQALRAKDTVNRVDTLSIEKNELAAAEAGNLTESKLTLDTFQSIYPEGVAEARFKEHQDKIKMYAVGNQVVRNVAGQSPTNLNAAMAQVLDKSKITGDDAAYQSDLRDFTARQLGAVMKLQEDDVVAWQEQYQPAVKQAKAALEGSTGEQFSAAVTRLNGIKLMYQGAPPRDPGGQLLVSEAESKLFLNRPMNMQTILSQGAAESIAGKLNAAKPKEFIKATSELLAQYPDDKQRMIVFNDLVTKGKLSQQYQFAWMNKDEWWIDTYVGAIHAGGDIKLTPDDRKEVEDYVINSPQWINLQATMTGDNMQRSSEIRGFREGATQFAVALVASGKSPKDAAKLSTELLIGSNLGFTKVNGHPLVISLQTKDGKRSKDYVDVVGGSLGYALQNIPIATIDQTPFTALQANGSEKAKLENLSTQINARAFWQTLDNNRVVLYGVDENNIQPFEIRDKQGKPFIVNLDKLPRTSMIGRRNEVSTMNATYTNRPSWLETE